MSPTEEVPSSPRAWSRGSRGTVLDLTRSETVRGREGLGLCRVSRSDSTSSLTRLELTPFPGVRGVCRSAGVSAPPRLWCLVATVWTGDVQGPGRRDSPLRRRDSGLCGRDPRETGPTFVSEVPSWVRHTRVRKPLRPNPDSLRCRRETTQGVSTLVPQGSGGRTLPRCTRLLVDVQWSRLLGFRVRVVSRGGPEFGGAVRRGAPRHMRRSSPLWCRGWRVSGVLLRQQDVNFGVGVGSGVGEGNGVGA